MSIQSIPKPSGKNLLETASSHGELNTFAKAVELAGLGDILRGPGPFTVFAPTDAAFDKLPDGGLDRLLKPENKTELASILNYHVVKGRRTAADMGKSTSAATVQGESAPVKSVGASFSIDGANVTSIDIASSNGLIHKIDKVNMPTVRKQ
ncbi:fasciclin domain-containing protein [Pseudomarimonas arenosa]|uniref:Fasciclin domain-containing protein n=1 Tax=Pseudomarimonas arenosa TaxID=2774145 RepID=A0AAW3ZLQ1_9GAMM|nr:fasciclin domain-containing protein [Pseudomarimonas arenosa]MBD8526673.1 fasciclin domain-containing protein [Pseudomarimonas arenosa]